MVIYWSMVDQYTFWSTNFVYPGRIDITEVHNLYILGAAVNILNE